MSIETVFPNAAQFNDINNSLNRIAGAILKAQGGSVRYGDKRAKAESSPTSRITYLYDAVGMTPAYMNFSSGKFVYGDWKDFIDAVARPVMLKTDGSVDYELNHENQAYKLDGTARR